jgi:hypothetical protein
MLRYNVNYEYKPENKDNIPNNINEKKIGIFLHVY